MAEGLELQLAEVFATVCAFGSKAQSFHWNVEGSDFYEHHKFFEHIAKKTWKCVDPLAELMRGMNIYVPYNYDDLKAHSKLSNSMPSSAREMLLTLLNDCRILLSIINSTAKSAEVSGHLGLQHFLGHKAKKFRKYEYWLVSASK